MKIKLRIIGLLVILCSTFATTAVFGQTLYTWTGAADGTNLATPGNWTTNGATPAVSLPSGAFTDTAQWDNVASGNLLISYAAAGLPGTGFGTSGINLILTANQTNKVQVISAVLQSPAIGINNVTINGPGGQFILGGPTNNLDGITAVGRPAGGTHDWINNSTNPAIITPMVGWQAGGGATYTIVFDGSGDWRTTNDLRNGNATSIILDKLGSGTWYWNGPTIPISGSVNYNPNSSITGPIVIAGGSVVLQWGNINLNNVAIQNVGTLLEYDAPAQSQTLGGVISGSAPLQVNNGTLTLQAQNTYTGTNLLTGGTLIVNTTENAGISGPLGEPTTPNSISFQGGTLQWSVNNVFDYSSRFDSSAGQAYNLNTGGQNVALTNNLISSGGTVTKLGNGTLTLVGTNSYSGATTVSAGKLVFQGPMTGTGNITVNDGAALGVTTTGTQLTPATLTVGTGSGATLEFNNVSNTVTAPLAPVNIASAGTVTININSGPMAPANSYPLIAWTSGTAPGVTLGILNGFIGTLSTNGNTIQLNVSATAYKWSGSNNASWDMTTPNNWIQNGGPVVYGANGAGPAFFDDTAAGNFSVTVGAPVSSTLLTVNNSANAYSITSSGLNNIGGSTPLDKAGSGTLTLLGGANTYTGVTTLSGGTLTVSALANSGSASDIGAAASSAASLVFNGGTLQYTGAVVSIDHLFTLGTGGGTIDASGSDALLFTNTGALGYLSTGPRTLNLTGTTVSNNTLAAVIADNGGPTALTKTGAGTWVLTGNNTRSGVSTIAGGVLQIGNGGATGSPGSGAIVDDTSLVVDRTGSLTIPGVISGNGQLTTTNGTVVLTANNTFLYGAANASSTIINGGTLQLGNGGANGSLNGAGGIVNKGLLIFYTSAEHDYGGFSGVISGTGNVIDNGSGLVEAYGQNTYTGWTFIGSGATFQPTLGNAGQLLTSVITNNGTLKFVRQDQYVGGFTNDIVGSGTVWKDVNNPNDGSISLCGTNTYAGVTNVYTVDRLLQVSTIIAGGSIVLGDGATPGAGTIVGAVMFTNSPTPYDDNRRLEFNWPDNRVFTNPIVTVTNLLLSTNEITYGNNNGITALGAIFQIGSNVTTLTANNVFGSRNIAAASIVVSNGVLQVGNGGTSGSIGSGNAAVTTELAFNRSDSVTFGGGITGTGTVVQIGSGTLTLTGPNTLAGNTTVSNGTLVLTPSNAQIGGNLNVGGGTLVPGAPGTVSTLTVSNNMTISAGTIDITLNKSLSPSNTVFAVTNGSVTASGGTLKVANVGPSLTVGDRFVIFAPTNGLVTGGGSIAIVSPGYTFANNLAFDGSVTVTGTLPPPAVTVTHSGGVGGQLILSWPAGFTGLHLQSQTNSLSVGLGTNWVTIPGTDLNNSYTNTIGASGTVFYRLAP